MNKKTSSQRLRAALYILHEKKNIKQDFEEWYNEQMEYFIKATKKAIKDNESN